MRLVPCQPLSGGLRQQQMFNVAGLVIAECLRGRVKVVVERRRFGILLENIVDHCFDFMGQKHPQILANNVNTESVNRTDDRLVFVLEGLQSGSDVVPELPGDDPVEGDDEDIVAINGQAFGVEDSLDSAHKAERLAGSRPGKAADRVLVQVDEGWQLGSANALVP